MSSVSLMNIGKQFGALTVLPAVDLTIPDGSFTVIVGPSGCGKSTLLRIIAGLDMPTDGQILIDRKDVTSVDPAERGVAMVFQSYALYPHMTVAENIGFPLKMAGAPKAEIENRVAKAAAILKLEPLLARKPKALSGGQRQRVAIGRAIVREPEVFLFDEPLSNLDAALRTQMRVELSELHRQLGATMIYVTHDQVEAMTMADQIVVMNGGRVEQVGAPMDLYNEPETTFVAGFLGAPKMNFLKGEIAARHGAEEIGIRPEHLRLSADEGEWQASVRHCERLGAQTVYYLALADGQQMVAVDDGDSAYAIGASVMLAPRADKLHRFADGRRLRN
ncbi:sugar ABC transporter ATP-binding protein [Xaviernesmea oryzae]|uniref:Sugar ABC transporter ATP-binding protein n=1 Tax=Xaviernesmea oryzae TaxID=464029 RepID=A0A1Q9AR78_9HYPH|nr:ABC transporter ATP-binding protein [Xaviernesmea oryzae]OLP57898.1 sugar ABC transporter ATP-binding protein [Xaviernesmea oryzae]SEL31991.1 multiple sugar transport system ATP-binding protein [Xaviernesmea oryzae]